MKLSVIILTYNSSGFIDILLSVLISKYKDKIQQKEMEIIVADNASIDETVKLARKHKEVYILENGGNVVLQKGLIMRAKRQREKFFYS